MKYLKFSNILGLLPVFEIYYGSRLVFFNGLEVVGNYSMILFGFMLLYPFCC